MNQLFSRRDASVLGRWWWTVDRWTLIALLAIIAIGGILSFAASPAVAVRLKLGTFFFVKRHLFMIPPAIAIMVGISLFNIQQLKRLSVFVYLIGLVLLVFTLISGMEIKGARRWIVLFGTSLQTSEIIKPAFAVLSAWMLSEKLKDPAFPGFSISFGLMALLATLLLMQPDLGMTLVVVMTWAAQLFVAGLPLLWIIVVACLGVMGLLGAYLFFPHVTKRIDQFLMGGTGGDSRHDLYQVTQSLEAFMQGGCFGKGPGEGIIKRTVPDAHADFVFSVAGEEFGFFVCLLIVALFAIVVAKSLIRVSQRNHLLTMMATVGIVTQFAMQAMVNMASALHLIPTKGMTMPFISYGGSSLVALAMAMGMLLALTRKRHGIEETF